MPDFQIPQFSAAELQEIRIALALKAAILLEEARELPDGPAAIVRRRAEALLLLVEKAK